jgi:hypothetical protein
MEQGSNMYEQSKVLVEAGEYDKALECIDKHLASFGDDVQALNDAGVILHCQGRSCEAVDYLVKAREVDADSKQVLWNLTEAYLGMQRADLAVSLFEEMEAKGILNFDVINRTASMLINNGDKAEALEVLLTSMRLWPVQQKVLEPMMEVVKNKRPRINFYCGLKGDTKFLGDIYEYAQERYRVKFCEVSNKQELSRSMADSDINWFEWCTDLAVAASKMPKKGKNIIRLHRFEAYGNWPAQVQWENIDTLILVGNSFVKQALLRSVPDLESRTKVVVIPNGVNLDRYSFVERQRGKKLGCIGYLNERKNPMLLLQCMQKLSYIDSEYKLSFAGNFQDPALEQYVRHMVEELGLGDSVTFDGWQEDINAWLSDKSFVVSGSIAESQGMGILEGMACGCKAVIHNFAGAGEIFEGENLFNISEEFCQKVIAADYEPAKYRSFVEQRYPLKKQLSQIDALFREFENEMEACSVSTEADFDQMAAAICDEAGVGGYFEG